MQVVVEVVHSRSRASEEEAGTRRTAAEGAPRSTAEPASTVAVKAAERRPGEEEGEPTGSSEDRLAGLAGRGELGAPSTTIGPEEAARSQQAVGWEEGRGREVAEEVAEVGSRWAWATVPYRRRTPDVATPNLGSSSAAAGSMPTESEREPAK